MPNATTVGGNRNDCAGLFTPIAIPRSTPMVVATTVATATRQLVVMTCSQASAVNTRDRSSSATPYGVGRDSLAMVAPTTCHTTTSTATASNCIAALVRSVKVG